MTYAQISGGLVVNVVTADAEWIDAQAETYVPLIDGAGIGWQYSGGEFSPPPPPTV